MRSSLVLFTLLLLSTASYSQGEDNNWHFGLNSSISFNTGSPVALPNSRIQTSECAASISDNAGNLLFYTEGENVYSANHAQMPNGNGLMAWGDVQQGVLIVPKPGAATLYYVFTIGLSIITPGGYTKDLTYSIVDMSLNGGLGNVTAKNILLDQDVTEKLTATKHPNGTDFWVVAKNLANNQFKSYQITASGINSPLVSAGGVPIQNNDFTGAIKISNNGCWLFSTTRGAWGNPGLLELFEFNNQTGIISGGVSTTLIEHPYGIEFSPDNSKFYIGQNDNKPLYQLNMNAGSAAQILASAVAVVDDMQVYSMLSAPDGKIYMVRYKQGFSFQRSLGIIENPNAAGTLCNVNIAGIYSPLFYNTSSLPNNFNLTYNGAINTCSGPAPLPPGCALSAIKLAPTITAGPVTVFLPCPLSNITVRIYNNIGQLLKIRRGLSGSEISDDISRFPNACYFFVVSGGGEQVSFKVVKQ